MGTSASRRWSASSAYNRPPKRSTISRRACVYTARRGTSSTSGSRASTCRCADGASARRPLRRGKPAAVEKRPQVLIDEAILLPESLFEGALAMRAERLQCSVAVRVVGGGARLDAVDANLTERKIQQEP